MILYGQHCDSRSTFLIGFEPNSSANASASAGHTSGRGLVCWVQVQLQLQRRVGGW